MYLITDLYLEYARNSYNSATKRQTCFLNGQNIWIDIPGKWKVKVKSLSRVRLLATPWTAAYQAPLPMGFSMQESWEGGAISFSERRYTDSQ